MSEPNWLTGVSNLDPQVETNIIQLLNDKILSNSLDNELEWMLNYYVAWDEYFSRFSDYDSLNRFMQNRKENYFPETIDKEKMEQRGQMGGYWNSVDINGTE